MFAAIFIPDFPVEAIVRLRPEWRERAVAAMEGMAPLLRVMAVNERAADAGLEAGMTKLQAEEVASASGAVLTMRSAEQEESAQAALLDVACGFSPRVEDTAPGVVVLDLAGLQRIFGTPAKIARDLARRCSEIGLEAQVAVAANPDAAVHAARGFSGVTVIPEGREGERLATLPVEVLSVTGALTQRTRGTQRSLFQKDSASTASSVSSSREIDCTELVNTLESWGVRNLRALAALPEVAVTERLGQAGLHWQRMARGATSRALNLVDPPSRFEETCELEHPLESLEPLSFLLNHMLEQLCARLSARALATNELRIALELDQVEDLESPQRHGETEEVKSEICDLQSKNELSGDTNYKLQIANYKCFSRTLRLPVPMLDVKVFLKLLQLDLQAHPPGAPVRKVSIEALAAEPRRSQNGLFEAGAPDPERLEVTLARIGTIVEDSKGAEKQGRLSIDDCRLENQDSDNRQSTIGNRQCGSAPRIGVAEVMDTHRPDAFRMQKFAAAGNAGNRKSEIRDGKPVTAMRMLRPPVAAQVTVRGGKPSRIECETVSGEISWAAGPWKSSGEWWAEQPWAREEWDVCVGAGCYRIYRESRGWFVEGTYD